MAKELLFEADARRSLEAGVDKLANVVRVTLDLKQGDRVLFAKYAGTEFKHEDDELLILSEKDVLGILVS